MPRATPEPPKEASRFVSKPFKSYKTKYAPCGSPKPTYTPKPKKNCYVSTFCEKCADGAYESYKYASYYAKTCSKYCCRKASFCNADPAVTEYCASID